MDEKDMKIVKPFLDSDGRIKQYPTKQPKKLLVLRYLWERFEDGRVYTEPEINAIINEWHTFGDHCLLRRELYDNWFLDREKDGTDYHRGKGARTADSQEALHQ